MQKNEGDSPPLPPAGVQGAPPGLRLPGLWGGVRGPGGGCPAGPAASASIGAQPQIRLRGGRGGGAEFQKKSQHSPDKIQVMGGGRRKSFSAESTEPTGLHPASTARGRHKAAPPSPLPAQAPLPRSPHALWPARGGGWAGPGLATPGRRRGGSSPAGRERGREPGAELARLPGVGAGAGARGCLPRNARQV